MVLKIVAVEREGAWANVVVKYTEQKDMKSKRENKTSFIFL